jgi:hypothetical protein
MLKLSEVKEFLRLDSDAEDAYIKILILLAREMCENYLRGPLPRRVPQSARQAQLLIVGYFYENREGGKEGIPPAVYALLDPYRKAAF